MTNDKPPETNVIDLLPGILKNVGEGQPGTENRTKVIGDNEIATRLSVLTHGEVSVSQLMVLMHQHGPVEVESALHFTIRKNADGKITNLGAFLESAIRKGWHKEKPSPRTQNRPNSGINSLNGNQQPRSGSDHTSPEGVSQENAIDKLKKENTWTREENKQFYLRLDPDMRKYTVSEVIYKWQYLNAHADFEKIDLLSDGFVNNRLFKQFSDVLNDIRLDHAARHLRTKVYQH